MIKNYLYNCIKKLKKINLKIEKKLIKINNKNLF